MKLELMSHRGSNKDIFETCYLIWAVVDFFNHQKNQKFYFGYQNSSFIGRLKFQAIWLVEWFESELKGHE